MAATLVSRTFYARGQTGQQLLLGAYGALAKEEAAGGVTLLPRREMLDLIVVDGRARGVIARDLVTGALETHLADAVVLATGGYANAYYLLHQREGVQRDRHLARAPARRGLRQSRLRAVPPDLLARDGRASGQAHAHVRVAAQRRAPLGAGAGRATHGAPQDIPESERDYFLERRYPRFGNLVPRDLGSRACKTMLEDGRGVGPGGQAVYLDLTDAARRLGVDVLRERYGNLFEMYQHITGDDPLRGAMRIAPAAHYTMGGLWVDYDLMSNLPGLFAIGEANFSDHGANRLGASALMQGLADGYFILPYTLAGYLAGASLPPVAADGAEAREALGSVRARVERLLAVGGRRTAGRFPSRARPRALGPLRARAQPARAGQGHRRDRRAPRGLLGRSRGDRARPASSTRSWSAPGAWPTSSSWAS